MEEYSDTNIVLIEKKKQNNKTKQLPSQTLLLTLFAVHYAWPFPDDFFPAHNFLQMPEMSPNYIWLYLILT